jgi:hypothetical protein
MKLSKALLGAIMVGITLQATTSCKKDKESITGQAWKKAIEKIHQKATPGSNCPACGMG